MKWLVLLLSLIILCCVCVAGWFYTKHKKAEAARLAWEQKIDECIVKTLRQEGPSKLEPGDMLDEVAGDYQVQQARKACISNDAYDQEHKHDRELYQRAFPQAKKN